MANKVEILARNMRLTDNTREYVEKKAAKLELKSLSRTAKGATK